MTETPMTEAPMTETPMAESTAENPGDQVTLGDASLPIPVRAEASQFPESTEIGRNPLRTDDGEKRVPPETGVIARRLRLGLIVVCAVVLALDIPTLLSNSARYRSFPLETAGYLLLAAATVAAVPFVVLRRPWGAWRWPLLIIAFAGATAATAAVAPSDLFGMAHWAWDIFGWWAVLFLLDRRLRELLVVLGLHLGVTVVQLAAAGHADLSSLVGMAISGLALGGLPVAVWLFSVAAARAAAIAARAAEETERVRTAERVAAEIHHDRQVRYADLARTAGPLLRRLESGEIDPGDDEVRHAFFVEAARLRRLFAESDDSDHPLVHEVTACADTAIRRGIVVNVAVRGECPPLPQPVRRSLTEAVVHALAAARSTARVTLIGIADRVTVTVVADVAPDALADKPDLPVTWDRRGDSLWMEATA